MFIPLTLPCYQYMGWYMKLGEPARDIRQGCLMEKAMYPPEKEKLGTWGERTYQEARKRLEEEIWDLLKDDAESEAEFLERREKYFVPLLKEIVI